MNSIKVIAPERGRHFHLDPNCRGLWRGWLNNQKNGHSAFAPETMGYEDAIDAGKYACKPCHKAAGIEVPEVADFAIAKAKRQMAKAEKIAAAQRRAEMSTVSIEMIATATA